MADLAINQTHIIFVAGAVVKNGKILVGKRGAYESHAGGKWALPGGKVDRTAGDCTNILEITVCREIREETGLIISPNKVQYVSSDTFIRSTGHHVVALLFKCVYKTGVPKPGEDTDELAWAGIDDLDKFDWAGGVRQSLEKLLRQYGSWEPEALER